MDLEVVGRHALLFDDDAMAEFTNSANALVEWNSLSIDRYDVRHLLTGPLPPRARRRLHQDDALESELDRERYQDLLSIPDEQDLENEAELPNNGGYHSVAFSYGEPHSSDDHNNLDAECGFRPPFSVPEHMVQKLMLGAGNGLLQGALKPPTEKVHQIIARTALFVHTHGGQSEIVLRVKQGDNPTFGFLMPDHDLHPYFRFLVDHQDLLKSDINSKSAEEENTARSSLEETGGALSLLGSLYGSAEDEEGASENTLSLKKNDLEEAVDPDKTTVSAGLQELDSSILAAARDEKSVKHHIPSLKDAPKVIRRNHSISTVKAGTIPGLKKEGGSSGCVPSTVDKVQNPSSRNLCKPELPIVEPPSDMKRVVDKIVEFILRNGKEFEAVLVQQDAKHGRFPFLSPSNQYHLYYLKALQKAQEPKLAGKSCNSEKNGAGEESESLSLPSDIPYDSDKKEKFKMVIGKSKREGQPDANTSAASQAQPAGVSMDAATTAAILQAARKGMTYPNLDIFSKNSQNCDSQGPSSGDGGEPGSFNSSRPHASTQKMVPLVKAIAKTAAIAAADEADSSEAGLTREQKLKSERLKRAKIFAAMIKGGAAAPLKNEPLHRVPSLEPPDSGLSRSGGASDANNVVDDRERDGSLAPMHADSSEKIEKMENTKQHADALMDRRSKRSYRPRSGKDEEGEEEMKEDGEEHKHSRKKRRSNGSSHHHSRDTGKHKRRRSSHPTRANSSDDEDGHSRHKHKESLSSEDEHDQKRRHSDRRRHKHNASSDDERKHPRHHHRDHNDSSGDERKHSRRRHNKHVESDDGRREHKRTSRRDKRVSKSRRDVEMEEGEVHAKSSDQSKASETRNSGSRETSVELSKSGRDSAKAAPLPEPGQKTDDVPDDLRAKVRAMLMATL